MSNGLFVVRGAQLIIRFNLYLAISLLPSAHGDLSLLPRLTNFTVAVIGLLVPEPQGSVGKFRLELSIGLLAFARPLRLPHI